MAEFRYKKPTMIDSQMASDPTAELLSHLTRAQGLLRQADETRWAEWLEKAQKLIEGEDFYGVEYLLKAFGGAASLNDVSLPEPARNAEFRKLRENREIPRRPRLLAGAF